MYVSNAYKRLDKLRENFSKEVKLKADFANDCKEKEGCFLEDCFWGDCFKITIFKMSIFEVTV